jgi:Fe-S cluster biogenesis protein NfuA/nitrite reductase/ring-hydroxylating ferredoxin subunit
VSRAGPDPRDVGERIESLLDASAAGGPMARERAEELVRVVVDLYGAGLERLLEIVHECGRLDDAVLSALAADDLVSSLLAVHGLHPDDVETRVGRALDGVRPYLGSHGGDVELVGIGEDGVVRLRMLGSCDGCPSSSVTLTLAVEGAVLDAAPEVTGVQVEEPARSGGVIPVSALRSRLDSSGGVWERVEGLAELVPGQVEGFDVAGRALVGTRIGTEVYVYADRCARCGGGLAGGVVERRLGGRAGDVVLRCPACRAHYDVRHAGSGLDADGTHLEPVPVLLRDGVASVAVPA